MLLKIVLIGDGGVGKTALRQSFMGLGFQKNYLMTLGADFATKQFVMPSGKYLGRDVRVQIWDLSGQTIFSNIRGMYYSGCHGAICVFDVSRPDTLENTLNWSKEAMKATRRIIPIVLVGNKNDLRGRSPCLPIEAGQGVAERISTEFLSKQYQVPYVETSAKTGEKVESIFFIIAEGAIEVFGRVM